ncbi:MAG: histidine kinase dimerization/phospho-acceptor domain-containing protein [Pseudomonadota bacterium]
MLIFAAVLGTAVAFLLMRGGIDAMRERSQNHLLWSATQLSLEAGRLEATLLAYERGDGSATAADVNLRFDIVWSRVEVFRRGTAAQMLRDMPAAYETVTLLSGALRQVEPLVVALGSGQELPDKAAAAQVRRTLGAYGDSLRGLNRAFLQLEVDAQTQTNALLLAKSSQLSAFAAATGVICLLLVMFYAADARRERRKTADTERLLRASAAAERSKARFLATMSHELHTPMNGVLGMIALARQPGLPGPQDRMLDRAAEAARQMDALLSDILDFAALEDDDATLDRAPFDPRALADQLAARLSPQAQREGATVHVIVEPGLPEKVLGDARRVKQALARLGGYLLQTSDAAVLQVTVSYRDGALRVEMGWPGGQGPSDLGAVALDGLSRDGPSPGIETEAVGLIVARGYLAKMHAQVALFGESRPVLRVVIPAVLATGAIRDAAPTLPTPRDTARGR